MLDPLSSVFNNNGQMTGWNYTTFTDFNNELKDGNVGLAHTISGSHWTVSSATVSQSLFSASADQNSQTFIFSPSLPESSNFYNTPFNPLINNATSSRKNTYIEVVEYDQGEQIPSNLPLIINRTAPKASVPDSNYVQKSWINPRYDGTLIESADYNQYTPKTSSIVFLNALSGSSTSQSSWPGDTSFGEQAVIDHNPIYFAHFKSSYNNLNLEGTYTFEIDSLIASPSKSLSRDITDGKDSPVVIKVDGSGNNLTEVRSTFELDRGVSVAYDSIKFNGVNYANIATGVKKIFQGSLEYGTIGASTVGRTGPSNQFSFPTFTPTMSFVSASWVNGVGNNYQKVSSSAKLPGFGSQAGYIVTGSGCLFLKGNGDFGQAPMFTSQTGAGNFSYVQYISGPGLAIINTLNTAVSESNPAAFDTEAGGTIASGNALVAIGIPTILSGSISKRPNGVNNKELYWRTNFSASGVGAYKEVDGALPFIIKVNDEIECVINDQINFRSNEDVFFDTQVFTVTGLSGSFGEAGTDVGQFSSSYCDDQQCFTNKAMSNINGSLRNAIKVYPDPSTLNIIGGQMGAFIIRRRVNADDRVIVFQSQPNAFGTGETTGSGGGYLIPNDFTPQQKRNTLTLINQLKAQNAFRDDSQVIDPGKIGPQNAV